jgi:hypothetical protein
MSGGSAWASFSSLYKVKMITQVVQFKNLDATYQNQFPGVVDAEQMIYLVKDNQNTVKSITTSVLAAIQKTQK